MSAPFTPEQSQEIDARIREMIAVVIGEGQYTRRWDQIAQLRANLSLADEVRALRFELQSAHANAEQPH